MNASSGSCSPALLESVVLMVEVLDDVLPLGRGEFLLCHVGAIFDLLLERIAVTAASTAFLAVVEYSENVAKHRCILRGWRVGHNPERRAAYLPGLCAASRRLNFLFASSKVFTIPSLDFQHPVELVRSLFVGSAE